MGKVSIFPLFIFQAFTGKLPREVLAYFPPLKHFGWRRPGLVKFPSIGHQRNFWMGTAKSGGQRLCWKIWRHKHASQFDIQRRRAAASNAFSQRNNGIDRVQRTDVGAGRRAACLEN
ncbi:hypothetical protein D0T21_20565 [Duganella sp. BJB476]|nr:hypothetical protein D0T21_20565 [Duganella sp. BJB476]